MASTTAWGSRPVGGSRSVRGRWRRAGGTACHGRRAGSCTRGCRAPRLLLRELQAKGGGKTDDAVRRRRAGGVEGRRNLADHGGDVDERPALLLVKLAQGDVTSVERPEERPVDDLHVILQRNDFETAHGPCTRVVDPDVDPAETRDGVARELGDVDRIGDVDFLRKDFALRSARRLDLEDLLEAAGSQSDGRARPGERDGRAAAEDARCARDDDDLALQVRAHVFLRVARPFQGRSESLAFAWRRRTPSSSSLAGGQARSISANRSRSSSAHSRSTMRDSTATLAS